MQREQGLRRLTRRGDASLRRVLAYENPRIVHGFLRVYDLPDREAIRLFRETRKFLWLMDRVPGLAVPSCLMALDEMWHAFILHTAEYARFCSDHFGRFVHHDPATRRHPRHGRPRLHAREAEALVTAVYDHLGPSTARLWFDELSRRYSPAALELRRARD